MHRSLDPLDPLEPRRARGRGRVGLLLAGLLLLAACDSFDAAEHIPEYVVESYQVAGEPLQSVNLSRTAPIDEAYDFSRRAVSGADVRVHLLDAAGAIEDTYRYAERTDEPGVYEPATEARVKPLRTYLLEVLPADGARITARTVVPGLFTLAAFNADTVVYQSTRQLELTLTPSRYPGRQGIFSFTTEALDPREEQLTDFSRQILEQADGELEVEDLRIRSSGILNEESFEVQPNGNLVLRFPWLAIGFYGYNRVTAHAVDDNLYDFIRSQSVQQGGSTLSPGEIPNVLEQVEGGTGIFGSLAQVQFDIYIAREEE